MKLTINLWWAIILSTFAVRAHGHSTNGTAVTDANSACVPEEKSCRLQARNASSQILSRRKRYLAFPEGSSISVAFCSEIGWIGNPSILVISWQFNWGVAYDLPNKTWIINERERLNRRKLFPKQLYQRRHRRELYRKLEVAVDSMGHNGRECILRALCESGQYFRRKKLTMIEELTRTVFTLPSMKVLPFEHEDLLEYDAAFRNGQHTVFCPMVYPGCNLSLIEFALGKYLIHPKNFM